MFINNVDIKLLSIVIAILVCTVFVYMYRSVYYKEIVNYESVLIKNNDSKIVDNSKNINNDFKFYSEVVFKRLYIRPLFLLCPDLITFNNKEIGMEFGVYSGMSISYIAKCYPNVSFYGFDSFEGLPEKWRDGFEIGVFKYNYTTVVKSVPNNVKLVKGLFSSTLSEFNETYNCVKFLHIDCDLYSSTNTVFQFIENKFCEDIIILFDEIINYNGHKMGEYKAFQEHKLRTNFKYELLGCKDGLKSKEDGEAQSCLFYRI